MDLNLADATPRTVQVLLIDGHGPDADQVSRYLAPSDHERYDLAVAVTLAEGLDHLRDHAVDCVLLDLGLPDVAGNDALRTLRSHASTVPVVALTRADDERQGRAALHAGAQDHIAKSDLTASILRRAIGSSITRQRQQRLLAAAHDVLAQEVRVREKAEVDLQRSAAELERSNADLAEFAYVAAHDLRSPLGIISGYTQLLGELPAVAEDADALDLVDHIHAGVSRMESLIDDLLSYCSIGAQGTAHAPVDLAVLAATTCVPLVQRADRGATIDLGALPTVMGDEGQLRQLLDNLTTNAVKFVPERRSPHVSVFAERLVDGWQITVADNGIGIPADARERAFGMFQRVHGEGGFPGTGIGLAICHRVVEQHGGRVWIEPNLPFGTKVCVWLRG
jgi:signal transduction histidine kinase